MLRSPATTPLASPTPISAMALYCSSRALTAVLSLSLCRRPCSWLRAMLGRMASLPTMAGPSTALGGKPVGVARVVASSTVSPWEAAQAVRDTGGSALLGMVMRPPLPASHCPSLRLVTRNPSPPVSSFTRSPSCAARVRMLTQASCSCSARSGLAPRPSELL